MDAILAKIDELKTESETEPEEGEPKLSEEIVKLQEQVKDLQAKNAQYLSELTKLQEERRREKADVLIEKYMREGKLTKAMVDAWASEMAFSDPEKFEKMMETMPVVVELGERGVTGEGEPITDPVRKFNEEMAKVAKERNISLAEARLIVARENPELAEEYLKAMRG